MTSDAQLFYVMLALPTLFGLTLVGEGMYKLTHYESGWMSIIIGLVFMGMVSFGYFYLKALI